MLDHTRTKWELLAYFHSKMSVVVWGILYFMYPPTLVVNELGYTLLYVSTLLAISGSLLGMVGLWRSNSNNMNTRYQGLILEFTGLLFAVGGPLGFFITSAHLTLELDEPQLHTVTGVAYALSAFIISRIFTVWRNLKAAS